MSQTIKISTATPAMRREASPTGKPAGRPSSKEFRDTASGCRARASADLVEAMAMSTRNGREILETSAASWTKRAEMLQRIENGIAARLGKPGPEQYRSDAPDPVSEAGRPAR
jgi:hypothetical protein